MGHGIFFDIHGVFQTPILPGVSEVEFDLEDLGAHILLDRNCFQVLGIIQIANIQLLAMLCRVTFARILILTGWIEGGIGTQLGNQVQSDFPDHECAQIIAKMPVHVLLV